LVQQIFKQPSHPYTKALLACRPVLHPKGKRLPVVSDFMDDNLDAKTWNAPVSSATAITSTATDRPILEVNNLCVWYPVKKNFLGKPLEYMKAVDQVSFIVQEGETLGLVGESGCGKTTLGRSILGLNTITSGSIHFKGHDLTHATAKQRMPFRRDMQLIFQDPYSSLNPRTSIGDAIGEPLLVHGLVKNAKEKKERVIDLLEKVQLGASHYHRYPHEFSGGQRQRIVIARALALEPSFIVCDESVSALDVSVQAQVLNLLNDLKKAFSFTAIFISHDLSVVKYISDRIMVMRAGKIEESGPAESVYLHPKTEYTRQLIDAIPGIG
jgi:peptide/nickel transport system ATP-binding protein